MTTPIMVALLIGGAVAVAVFAVYQFMTRKRTRVAERLETYAAPEKAEAPAPSKSPLGGLLRALAGRGYFEKLEDDLARADMPLRPSEYVLLRLVLAGFGFIFGAYLLEHFNGGVFLAIVGYFIPVPFVRVRQARRRNKFVRQLADALMLLANSLRAGYSFLKGLELVSKEMDPPISVELARMLREINLGATVDDAMNNLGRRINSPDLDIVISAFLVQREVGGNLTEIVEKVAETIRERIRIQGDVRVLTAQGRLTGLFIGALPIAVGIFIWLIAPDYFAPIFGEPYRNILGFSVPHGVFIFALAFAWQLIGAVIIYKIVNIKI
jgi:tight adherence protein B